MSFPVIQSWKATPSSATTVTTSPTNPFTAGSTVVLVIAEFNRTVSSISGGGGTTWTKDVGNNTGTGVGIDIWSSSNVSAGTPTISIVQSSGSAPVIFGYEIGGTAAIDPVDKTATASATSTTLASGTTATLSQANEVAIAGGVANNAATAGPTGGYTGQAGVNGSTYAEAADLVASATTAQSTSWTISNAAYEGVIATYKYAPLVAGDDEPRSPRRLGSPYITPTARVVGRREDAPSDIITAAQAELEHPPIPRRTKLQNPWRLLRQGASEEPALKDDGSVAQRGQFKRLWSLLRQGLSEEPALKDDGSVAQPNRFRSRFNLLRQGASEEPAQRDDVQTSPARMRAQRNRFARQASHTDELVIVPTLDETGTPVRGAFRRGWNLFRQGAGDENTPKDDGSLAQPNRFRQAWKILRQGASEEPALKDDGSVAQRGQFKRLWSLLRQGGSEEPAARDDVPPSPARMRAQRNRFARQASHTDELIVLPTFDETAAQPRGLFRRAWNLLRQGASEHPGRKFVPTAPLLIVSALNAPVAAETLVAAPMMPRVDLLALRVAVEVLIAPPARVSVEMIAIPVAVTATVEAL